jgi:hypothetical protein
MKASSLFAAGLAAAILSHTATPSLGATSSLPNVVVEAPKQVAAPQRLRQRGAARSTVSPAAKLANGGCPHGQPGIVGGCITSFRIGDRPWSGCSLSSGTLSSTCNNLGPGGVPFKSYNQCMEVGITAGWRSNEMSWFCSSLALK